MQLKTGFPVNISDFGKFHSSLTLCSHLQFIGYIRINNFFLNFKPNIDENERNQIFLLCFGSLETSFFLFSRTLVSHQFFRAHESERTTFLGGEIELWSERGNDLRAATFNSK